MSAVHVVTNMTSAAPQRSVVIERRKLSLATLARRRGLNPRRAPVICQRNGKWVKQTQWCRVTAKRDDVVIFVVLPRGGGNVLRTVAMIAVVIIAAAVAGPLAASIGAALEIGAVGTALIQGGIAAGLAFGGSLLVNALIPIRTPDGNLGISLGQSDSASPTYAFSVSSQQNVARLGGAIPALYGRMRFIPDLAATAWWEWSNGTQKLYQTLLLTQGSLDVEKIELGRTPLSTFEEIQTELIGPGGAVTLFEPEVFQAPDVRGILMHAPNDLPAIDDGTYGPFAACPPGVTTDRIGVDIGFPRGLFTAALGPQTLTQWRVEAQQIDDAGVALGAWTTVATESFNGTAGASNTSSGGTFMGGGFASSSQYTASLTLSYRYTLSASARWQVRVTRLDNKDLTAGAGDEVAWAGLRGFMGGGNYGAVTVLAIRTTASSSVNDQTIRQIAVTGTRKLPVWNGTSWSAPVATRSIAAAAADMITNQTYGGRRGDGDYDLAHLAALDATWAGRADTFDYYFSKTSNLWSALQIALRAGRAQPFHQAGLVRFYRDELQALWGQKFSRENIVKGSFTMKFVMPSPETETDGIEVKYFNETTWNFASIRQKNDMTSGDPVNPSSTTLDGVVNATQAQRETDYIQAADRLRRIFVNFDTEMEGMIPSRGDAILVSHDAPRWGQSTRILTWDAGTRQVGLWGRPDWGDKTGTWYAVIRDKRGRASDEIQIASIDDDYTVTLAAAPTFQGGAAFPMDVPAEAEPLHISVGKDEDRPRRAIFLGATPRGGAKISVSAVLEDDAVHVN